MLRSSKDENVVTVGELNTWWRVLVKMKCDILLLGVVGFRALNAVRIVISWLQLTEESIYHH